MTGILTFPTLIVATLLLLVTTCRTGKDESMPRAGGAVATNCGLQLSSQEILDYGAYSLLKPGNEAFSLLMKDEELKDLTPLFACQEQAAHSLRAEKPLIIYIADESASGSASRNREKIFKWLLTEHPGSLIIELAADCQAAIQTGDHRCLHRVKLGSEQTRLVFKKDKRHDELPRKSSHALLKPHLENFEKEFNKRLQTVYPLLFAEDNAKQLEGLAKPWRYEERYLLDREQAVVMFKQVLMLLHRAQDLRGPVIFVGLGQGAEVFVKGARELMEEKQRFPKNTSSVLFNLPGWAQGEGLGSENDKLKYLVLSLDKDLRVQSSNFFRYFFFRQVLAEHVASFEDLPQRFFRDNKLRKLMEDLEKSGQQVQVISEPQGIHEDEFVVTEKGPPLSVKLPVQNDLQGDLHFEINLKDSELKEGMIYPLFQYGACTAAQEQLPELMPRAWLEKKKDRLHLKVALQYQGEEHRLDSYSLDASSDAWQKIDFNWQLPVKSSMPTMVSVIELATFFDRAPKAESNKYLGIMAWMLADHLPSSYTFQQGHGMLNLNVQEKKISQVEIKPAKGGKYFRDCIRPNEKSDASLNVFTDFDGRSDWDLVKGSVCKGIIPHKDITLNFACAGAAPGLKIRGISTGVSHFL